MRTRDVAGPLCLWLLVVCAVGLVVAGGQAQEREGLADRFQNRADTGAGFVASYVADVFTTEERLVQRVLQPGWQPSEFAQDATLLGFPAAVLLDPEGRVVALAPSAPELDGTELAARYAHLDAALAGTPTVSDVVPSAVSGDAVVAFALPIADERFGVLSGAFSPTDGPLAAFLDRQPIAGTVGVLLDSRGEVIASTGNETTRATTWLPELTSSPGTPVITDERVVVAAPVEGTGWTYVLDAPRETLVAPATANDLTEWLVLAFAALITLVVLLVAQRAKAQERRALAAKEQLDERLRLTVENAPVGMALVSLGHRFMEPNRRLCEMLGYSPDELVELTLEDVTHPDDVPVGLDRLALLVTGEIDKIELEKRYVRSDGTLLWGRSSVSLVHDERGEPSYFVNQVEDVTEVRRARAELQRRALYDPLTRLANRSLLMDRMAYALGSERRYDHVGVAFCDLDHFKAINDTHGHAAGDQVLKEVARRLQESVRAEDTVARLGGDEFVVLLHAVASAEEAMSVMQRAGARVKEPIVFDGATVHTSLSGGLTIAATGSDPELVLRDADAALYVAKNSGRGRITMASGQPRVPTLDKG